MHRKQVRMYRRQQHAHDRHTSAENGKPCEDTFSSELKAEEERPVAGRLGEATGGIAGFGRTDPPVEEVAPPDWSTIFPASLGRKGGAGGCAVVCDVVVCCVALFGFALRCVGL